MLEVVTPGLLSTIQDAGRPDYADVGVPTAGACDPLALAAANLLLGNDAGSPALEMTLTGPELRVLTTCVAGLAGADLGAHVEDRALAPGATHLLWAGSTVSFRGGSGARAYLSLPGGIDAPQVLGSASTYLPAGFGGLEGRALLPGDRLVPLSPVDPDRAGLRWPDRLLQPAYASSPTLRVVAGPHHDRFARDALDSLRDQDWEVRPESDRMGVRVSAASPLGVRLERGELLSEGMVWGAVQVPTDGQPIILMADHQTVGGYPVLAVVIRADRPLLGQLAPGDRVRFASVTLEEAQQAYQEQQDGLRKVAVRLGRKDPWDLLVDSAAG